MKTVHDSQLLEKAIKELELDHKINRTLVRPVLLRFEKGELLSGPHIRQSWLLFVLSGIVQIYGIGLDGRKIPVNIAKRGSVIGDVEFCNARNSNLFSEVVKEVTCVGISIRDYRKILEEDVVFLRFLLRSVSEKVYLTSVSESPVVSVEEKLLHYMENECEGNLLSGVEHAAMRLQCSRRHLQRVLQKLCEAGEIEKAGKGKYRLVYTSIE